MANVLVVEDEPDIASVVAEWVARDNHQVDRVESGSTALDMISLRHYDLIILDWMLPDTDGIEVCKRYRARGGNGHVLMLTARTSIDERAYGLESGADDYLSKPFHLKELVARVRALLRRPAARVLDETVFGEITINSATGCVTRGEHSIAIVPRELEILRFLLKHRGRFFTAEAILDRVWPASSTAQAETVRTHVKNIRKKLDVTGATSLIEHVRGFGYRIPA